MKFTLEIESEDEAAIHNPVQVVRLALLKAVEKCIDEDGDEEFSGTLRDENGNRIGKYEYTPNEVEDDG